ESRFCKRRMTLQRRYFRREDDIVAGDAIIERLFAEPVADEEKGAGGSVAIGKGEHPIDSLDGAPHAFATYQVEKYFGIRAVAQRCAEASQFGGEIAVPVYFSIVDERVARELVDARLCSSRDVDDREPRMTQGDA